MTAQFMEQSERKLHAGINLRSTVLLRGEPVLYLMTLTGFEPVSRA